MTAFSSAKEHQAARVMVRQRARRRGLETQDVPDPTDEDLADVKAVLSAIKDPTKEMLTAGLARVQKLRRTDVRMTLRDELRQAWRVMAEILAPRPYQEHK